MESSHTNSQIKQCKDLATMPIRLGEELKHAAMFKNGNWHHNKSNKSSHMGNSKDNYSENKLYISLKEVKLYLRLENDLSNDLVISFIKTAQEAAEMFLDISLEECINESIKTAMLMHVESMYDQGIASKGMPEATIEIYKNHRLPYL